MGFFNAPSQQFPGAGRFADLSAEQGKLSEEFQRKHNVDRFGNPMGAAAANQPAAASAAEGAAPTGARRRTRQGTILTNPGGLTSDQQRNTLLTA